MPADSSASLLSGRVKAWLAGIETVSPTLDAEIAVGSDRPRRKRKRASPPMTPPATSPSSANDAPRTPSKKRQRSDQDADADADGQSNVQDQNDATPRPPTLPPRSGTSSNPSSLASSASSRQSPIKQLRSISLSDKGFSVKHFDSSLHELPQALADLRRQMVRIGRGEGVIPRSLKADADKCLLGQELPGYAFCPDPVNDKTILAWSDALRLLQQATLCAQEGMTEAAWNMEVHHLLLSIALRPQNRLGLVDFRVATQATMIKAYKPYHGSKLVDFCICINPSAAGGSETRSVAHAIDRLCNRAPGNSVNQTAQSSLQDKPIVVSIETKRLGGDENEGTLQIGTWQAAQFGALKWLEALASALDPAPSPPSRQLLPAFEFLPGILIVGHQWFFVASTPPRAEAETQPDNEDEGEGEGEAGASGRIYTKVAIGSTENILGLYSIVAALGCLKDWAEQTYWPIFQARLLNRNTTRSSNG